MINAIGAWIYSAATNRYLYLLRNDRRNPYCWGLPGGKVEDGENLMEGLKRECVEELGLWPAMIKVMPLEKFTSNDGNFCYHTFFCVVPGEFAPCLNDEHSGWAWIDTEVLPKPLHPGLWTTVNLEEVKTKVDVIKQQFQQS